MTAMAELLADLDGVSDWQERFVVLYSFVDDHRQAIDTALGRQRLDKAEPPNGWARLLLRARNGDDDAPWIAVAGLLRCATAIVRDREPAT